MRKGRGADDIQAFFSKSDLLDREVLRPLSHIRQNWELTWDGLSQTYSSENDSYADALNQLIDEISRAHLPKHYHLNEDVVVNYLAGNNPRGLRKKDGKWEVAHYGSTLEQGGFHDIDQQNLFAAAVGRVHMALRWKQRTYDEVEEGHRAVLADLLSIILFHRHDYS